MKTRNFYTHVWLTLFLLLGMLAGSGGLKAQSTAKWTYDSTERTLTLSDPSITLENVTVNDSELTIGDNHNNWDLPTTLDLSLPVDEGYTITALGEGAFSSLTKITSVTLPSTLKSIGVQALYNTRITSIEIPSSVTEIGNAAFFMCSLTSITWGANPTLKSIGEQAFENNTNLTSIELPASLETLGERAFNGCTKLTSLTFAGTPKITALPGYFITKTGITSFTIPESVTKLQNYAFSEVKQLTALTIPASVTTYGTQLFQFCTALKTITCNAATEPTGMKESNVNGRIVYAYKATSRNWDASKWGADKVKYGTGWTYDPTAKTLSNEEDGITLRNVTANQNKELTIGDNQRSQFNNIAVESLDFTLPIDNEYTITALGENAFFNQTMIKAITLPATLKSIGENALRNINITNITIPNTVTEIGNYAFITTPLTTITWSSALASIGIYAFSNTDITSVELPASLKTLGSYAFEGCDKLTSLTFAEGAQITELTSNFIMGTGITSFTIPALVTKLNTYAFAGTKLTALTIPATVKIYGQALFQDCPDLKAITCNAATEPKDIRENAVEGRIVYAYNAESQNWDASKWGADEIKYGADWKYSNTDATITRNDLTLTVNASDKALTITGISSGEVGTALDLSGTVGYSTTNDYTIVGINANVFQSKTTLTTLTLPASVTTIGDNAFDGCTALTTITSLRETEPTINTDAFANGPEEGRKVFAFQATDISSWNADNKWGTNSTVIDKFNWTYENGTLSNPNKSVILTVTSTNNTLTVTGSTTLADNANLDLSGYYGDADKKLYSVASIAANAFAGKTLGTVTLPASIMSIKEKAFDSAKIDTLRMLGDIPGIIGTDAFKLRDAHTCIVRVPDGQLTDYHIETAEGANYTNWCNLPYILEESGETYAITYSNETTGMTDTDITYPDFKATFIPIGQRFKFVMQATDTLYYLQVKAFDGATEIKEGFSYQDSIVSICLTEKPASNLTFKVFLVKPIVEETGKDITINSKEEYTDGTDTKPYNGQIGDGTKQTEVKSLKIEATTEPLTVLLNQVQVAAAESGSTSTTITESTEVTFSLIGTNDLGTVENNGTLTLQAGDNTASLNTTQTVVTNNGTFIDYTGLLTTVKGEADLTVNKNSTSASEEKVKQGAFIVLKAEGSSTNDGTISYEWQKKVDNQWKNAKEPLRSRAAGDGTAPNELKVLAADAGDYRCLITSIKEEVKSTLTHYTTVKVEAATPPPYIPSYYTVTVHAVEGAITDPAAGTYSKEEGYTFSFSLELQEGYRNSTPVVKANGVVITPNVSDGKYVIRNIYEDTDIVIEGVKKDTATGNAGIEGVLKVQAIAGVLHINLPQDETAYIFTASGRLYKEAKLTAGSNRIPLSQGIFFVKIAGKSYKVVSR